MRKKISDTFPAGIIDIGSHSARLDLFAAAPDGTIRLLESLDRPLNLGFDVFRNGAVSSQSIHQLSSVMGDFARKLDEYGAAARRVVATSAIREAFNRELVISRIRHDSGLEIEILEAQEEARITFLSTREELRRCCDFDRMTGIAFIIGTGSLIVIFFENGLLKFYESAPLGTIRFYDEFGRSGIRPKEIVDILISSAIEQRLRECARLRPDQPLALIGIGAGVRLLVRRHETAGEQTVRLSVDTVADLARQAMREDPQRLGRKLNIPDHQAMSLAPCGSLISYFLNEFNCSEFLCPSTTTRTALLDDLVRRTEKPDATPFLADMLAAAEGVGQKYGFDVAHARSVGRNALALFDKLKRYYDFPPRSRIWLEIAALLHDIGRFIDVRQHHKHSWYLISHAQLPGLSPAEQRIIATVARYHRKAPPKASHPEYMALGADEKVAVLKLAAILRVADALDRAHCGRYRNLKLKLRGDELIIHSTAGEDRRLEELYLKMKSDMFRDVFGLQLKLEEVLEKL